MHRTIGDSFGLDGTKRIFRQENSPSYQATQVDYTSMNALQEEIARVIEAEGITLQTATETIAQMVQLNTAINAKVLAEATIRNAADKVADGSLASFHIDAANARWDQATLDNLIKKSASGLLYGFGTTRHSVQLNRMQADKGVVVTDDEVEVVINTTDAYYKRASIPHGYVDNADNNGIATDVPAVAVGGWLHMFAIQRKSDGLFDIAFDTDPTGANLVGGTDDVVITGRVRRIGGAQVQSIVSGEYRFYKTRRLSGSHFFSTDEKRIIDVDLNGITFAVVGVPAPTGIGSIIHVYCVGALSVNSAKAHVMPRGSPSGFIEDLGHWHSERDGSGNIILRGGIMTVPANWIVISSSQDLVAVTDTSLASQTLKVGYLGYIDSLGTTGPTLFS